MDPLSLAASIIAVLTLTSAIGSTVTNLIRNTKTAPTELIEINKEVESLALVLRRLQVFVNEEQRSNASAHLAGRQTWPHLSASDIEIALGACETTVKEIGTKATQVEKLMRGRSFDKVKYPFSWTSVKKDLRDLRARLEYSKTSILMSLQLRVLEVVKAMSQTSTNTEASIRDLMFEVQLLRALQESRPNASGSPRPPIEPTLHMDSEIHPAQLDVFNSPNFLSSNGFPDVYPCLCTPAPLVDVMSALSEYRQADITPESKHLNIQEIETHANIGAWLSRFQTEAPSDGV